MTQISTKPASGFRDFLPAEVRRRDHVFRVIEEVYESYGFEKLDTPCVERLDTLMGKYGEEGDQLIFKILQRGDKLTRALEEDEPGETDLADMGLRYDLTVPLARVYADNSGSFPRYFKRYQIAPVWRADRPQKGRFREFYQCDVDVAGSTSMTVEAEVTSALAEILNRLEFKGFRIHVNHRQLLRAMMQKAEIPDYLESDALIAIDKLDKIEKDGVVKELEERGISSDSVEALMRILESVPTIGSDEFANEAVLDGLRRSLGELEDGATAIEDLEKIMRYTEGGPAGAAIHFDPYLARGLSYYTGPIFEIRSDDFSGSLGGGGRYDTLIGMFSKQDVPACGFSLGVERILVVMEDRGMFDDEDAGLDALVTLWNSDTTPSALSVARDLRNAGYRVDVYCDEGDRYGKQFKYADQRNAPVVIILGPDELESGEVSVKNMKTGDQEEVARGSVVEKVRSILEQ